MQRRGSSGQPVKGQSANRPKARNAPTAQVSTADLQEQLDRRTRERDEALEQLAAASQVLQVISSSPGKLEPVFEAMLENAVRICGANFGNLWLREGDAFRIGAMYGAPPAFADYLRTEHLFQGNPGMELLVRTKEPYHLADLSAVPTRGEKLREAIRRPSRHRHREHASAQRTAPAHRRFDRVAGPADRD
jgi:hypothetical protein